MRFAAAFIVAAAGLVAAQSSTSSAAAVASGSPSGCGSATDAIIQACLSSTQPGVAKCAVQDWHCLCTQQKNVVTCYNNCPSDPDAFGAKQKETSYCNAAKTVPSSSSAVKGNAKTTAAASSSSSGNSGPQTGFAKGSGSASSAPNAAPTAMNPVGGLLAAAMGLALL